MKKMILGLCVFIIFAGLVAVYAIYRPYDSDNPMEIELEIPKGSSSRKIAEILKESELIRSSNLFLILIKKSGLENDIKAGRYTLKQDMDYDEIISKLSRGNIYTEVARITIPEGYEIRQIIDLLVSNGLAEEEELKMAMDPSLYSYSFLGSIENDTLEGFLFPDTYDIPYSYEPKKIVEIFLNRFDDIFNDEYTSRLSETGMSINEAITLASIIERETRYPEERKTVSGVFVNRMERNMRLESCATVQYAIGEWKETLSYEDTSIESPYNTYRNKGLPPGPIASPGEDSIKAALYPEEHGYYFFFAIPGDSTGRHVFSKTYNEHLAAQARYKD